MVYFAELLESAESDEPSLSSELTISTPSLSESESERLVSEHEPVTIMCTAPKGDKPITWFKDGKEIKDGDDGCIVTLDGGTWKLIVPKSEEANFSVYTAKCGEEDVPVKIVTLGKSFCRVKSHS